MTDGVDGPERAGDVVPHQDLVEEVITDTAAEMLDGVASENVVIADLVAITGGEAPTETEHNLVITKVNAILAALRRSTIVPTS